MQTKILIGSVILVCIFIALRYHHYSRQRREEHHDEFLMVRKTDDGKYKKCANLDMIGFKFSTILALAIFNLILTLYLVSIYLKIDFLI